MSQVSKQQTARADTTPGAPLVRVSGLSVGFPTGAGVALAVQDVAFDVLAGETLGIVGESGCGKSMTLRALLGLVPEPGEILGGEIVWSGETDLLHAEERVRDMRGRELSMIFQDPLESLNPVFSVGDQLTEVLRKRGGRSRRAAREEAVDLLERVGIPSATTRMKDFPHQLSGGMRQRVMIAIAIACGPTLVLADEPTTALDVTIQDQILGLLAELQRATNLSMVLVSHDLNVVAQMADRVAVMYAGHIVETGSADEVLLSPRHPYTAALIAAAPRPEAAVAGERPEAIGGSPPALGELPPGCPFAPRCRFATAKCAEVDMTLQPATGSHKSACPVVEVNS